MAKYIDAEKLTELCNKVDGSQNKHLFGPQICDFLYHVFIPKVLEETPHVDAVEVIRCKDCKYYNRNLGEGPKNCIRLMYTTHALSEECMVREDDFCSYAERKED